MQRVKLFTTPPQHQKILGTKRQLHSLVSLLAYDSPRFTNLNIRRCSDVQGTDDTSTHADVVCFNTGDDSAPTICYSPDQATGQQSARTGLGKHEFRYLSLSTNKMVGQDERGRVHVGGAGPNARQPPRLRQHL